MQRPPCTQSVYEKETKTVGLQSQSGYVHKFYISGDNLMPTNFKNLDPAIGKSGRVLLNLANSLPRGTHLYFDSYFACPSFYLSSKSQGIMPHAHFMQTDMENAP